MLVSNMVAIAEAVAAAPWLLKLEKKQNIPSYALVTLCSPFSFSFVIMRVTTESGSLWQWLREMRLSGMENVEWKYEVYIGELLW